MRGGARRQHREEEEESAFVSMTDMTVSFLFIIMILLAFFASQFNPEETVLKSDYETLDVKHNNALATIELQSKFIAQKDATIVDQARTIEDLLKRIAELEIRLAEAEKPDPVVTYLAEAQDARTSILKQLRDSLQRKFTGLQVEISEQNDALRFQGDGLFASGQRVLRDDKLAVVDALAQELDRLLPCYTTGARAKWDVTCNPNFGIIEALQIEGHTDSDGNDISNLQLSTDRANDTYGRMLQAAPGIVEHLNSRGETALSVAGYGESRRLIVPDENDAAAKATNRRIDLRIIMFTPGSSEEIERIRKKLQAGVGLETP